MENENLDDQYKGLWGIVRFLIELPFLLIKLAVSLIMVAVGIVLAVAIFAGVGMVISSL